MTQLYVCTFDVYSPEKRHAHDLTSLQLLAAQHGFGYELVSQVRGRNWQNWGRVTLYSKVKLSGGRQQIEDFVSRLTFR